MSEEKLWNNAHRWYRQAENDVDAADVLLEAGNTSFLLGATGRRESDEGSVDCTLDQVHGDIPSLVSFRIYRRVSSPHSASFEKLQMYIPTRYPDALADLIPSEGYTKGEAEQACRHADELVSSVSTWLDKHEP